MANPTDQAARVEAIARIKEAVDARETGVQTQMQRSARSGEKWSNGTLAQEREWASVPNLRLSDLQIVLAALEPAQMAEAVTIDPSQPATSREAVGDGQDRKFAFRDGRLVNRVSGEAIPTDEPIIIFRARDKHALPVLNFYRALCSDGHHRQAISDRISEFEGWAHRGGLKEPGITHDIELNALTPAPAAGVEIPEGYALVPIEPTGAMIGVGYTSTEFQYEERLNPHDEMRKAWSAMLAATPTEALRAAQVRGSGS